MRFEERLSSLKRRHEEIESNIHNESTRPYPDDDRVHNLKRMKLAIKDEIAEINQRA